MVGAWPPNDMVAAVVRVAADGFRVQAVDGFSGRGGDGLRSFVVGGLD